jgi:nitrogen regulatory protein P-II 2
MTTYPMKRVTVVCEAYARQPVSELMATVGAHGWTVFPVEGRGHQGTRLGDIPESANVQFEVIVQPGVAETLLQRLHAELFPNFAMVAYESDIRVLRRDKF